MPRARLIGATLGAALLWAGWGARPARAELTAQILQYGEMRGQPAGERDPALRDDTLSGVQPIRRPSFPRLGSSVEGRFCGGFGIMFQVRGLPPGGTAVLHVRNTHPLLTRSDGVTGTVDDFEVRVSDEPSWVGFTFSETWSLVPGRWTITLFDGDRQLAEQSFDVTKAADPGTLEGNGCATPTS